MEVTYYLQRYEFEWDITKARSNLQKHGVTFEEAAEVFLDPFCQMGDASDGWEQRDFVIGYSHSQRVILTVYTERRDRIRIISARLATRVERKLYEEA